MSARNQLGVILLACALALGASGCGGGGGAVTPPPVLLAIVTTSLPDAIRGQFYSQSLQATGGRPPYSWSIAAGSIAPGLVLNTDGSVTGSGFLDVPATDFSFTARVRDSVGTTATGVIHMNAVGNLRVTTAASLPGGQTFGSYSQQITVANGTAPFTFSVAQGSNPLPAGLTLNSTGLLAGTPTAAGSFSFTIQVGDSGSPAQIATAVLNLAISGDLTIISSSLPLGVQNVPYNASLQAAGGTPPYTWTLQNLGGPLPTGLAFSSSGTITGTPSVSASVTLFIQVADSSQPAPQTFVKSLLFNVNPPIFISTSPPLPDGAQNTAYGDILLVAGGFPPYTLQVSSGALPAGVTLQSPTSTSGVFQLTGTPTALGTSVFTMRASDSESPPATADKQFTLRINPALTATIPTSLPEGIVGQPYSFQFNASGGLPPLQWFTFSGNGGPPAGVTLNANTGLLSGTPTVPFRNAVTIGVFDSSVPPQTITRNPGLYVADVLRISTSTLPPVVENTAVSMQLAAKGGTGPFTWAVISGALPSGVALDTSGKITGNAPAASGNSNFTVRITDAGPPAQTATAALTFSVTPGSGRNDTIAAATPLSNGTYTASISPFADPPGTPPAPDVDVYEVTANPGAVVQVETRAARLVPPSSLDTVIELVDADGNRLQTCNSDSVGLFGFQCMNDDSQATTDSRLFFQVPPSATSPVTFYVRVLDWSGDARPDLIYQISVSGAN